MRDRSELLTEKRLPESIRLDVMSIEEAVALMNAQDERAVAAVGAVRPQVVQAVQWVARSLASGGRLFYVGAGTSGRLGVLDASECPPTFRTDPDLVQGIIAGGDAAMFRSQEGAEDSTENGATAIDVKEVGANDVVLGIAAGGRSSARRCSPARPV
jgi:N-acetylmuramic acid 6-phosphate etherase